MWNFESTMTTSADPAAIWALYSDITTWPQWDQGISQVSLNGPFAVGTRGVMQPKDQEALPYQLTEVDPCRGFSDVTDIPGMGVAIQFTHRLERVDGGTRITHSVRITGSNAEELAANLGPVLTHGIPETMERLAAMALTLERHRAD